MRETVNIYELGLQDPETRIQARRQLLQNMEDALLRAIAGDDNALKKALQALDVRRRERDAFLQILKETEFREGVGTAVDKVLAELEALADAKMEEAEEHAMEGLQAAEERAMRDTYSEEEEDIGDEDLAEEEDMYNEEEEDMGDEDIAEEEVLEVLEEEGKEEALKDIFDRKLKTGAFLEISSDSD